MKKLKFIAVLFLSVVLFSCNNAESNENNENSDTTKVENIETTEDVEEIENISNNSDDFEIFWTEFQTIIASGNKQDLLDICNESTQDFLNDMFEDHVNEKMRTDVAQTTAEDVNALSSDITDFENERIYFYVEHYDDPESVGSSFGFWFEKNNGKWIVSAPQMGG